MSDELLDPVPEPDVSQAMQGLRGQRVIVRDADDLVDCVAREMSRIAHQRLNEVGEFHLALSGGSTPQGLYQRLMIDPRFRLFPWRFTHLWIVDERCVPLEDDRSNFKIIRELIVEHSDIPQRNVHPMPVTEARGDERYERELRALLSADALDSRLDYVLLGMGSDAHTASLFPNTAALEERSRWVILNDGSTVAQPRPRMTLTFPVINAARRIGILVTGEAKYAALRQVADAAQEAMPDIRRLPISGVKPMHEDTELTWYLDYAAALGPRTQ